MKFVSTRNSAKELNFEEVVLQGLASDGGLYVPSSLPKFSDSEIQNFKKLSYPELFFEVTKYFIDGEIPNDIYQELVNKSYKKFSHSAIAPLKQLDDKEFLLELFHGPTLAFKDFALQFLGNLLDYFLAKRNQKIVIIGATSGDTGSAAIHGCMACKNAQIFILHPHNKVSAVQRKQMTTVLADNVFNLAVEGNFDDCQSMVKAMFNAESSGENFLKGKKMVAVNSINFARIMAQIAYYFYSAIRLGCNEKNAISFSVPSGNFGDIYAGFLAKRMGLNINKLIVATNSNDILNRFIRNNDYSKDKMIETNTPSMNIQVSSNFERLLFDYHNLHNQKNDMANLMANFEKTGSLKVSTEILKNIQSEFLSYKANDITTSQTINEIYKTTGEILDPHSAIGVYATKEYIKSEDYQKEIVVTLATAHPAKFPDAVKEAINLEPNLPIFLQDLFEKEERFKVIKNDFNSVKDYISNLV